MLNFTKIVLLSFSLFVFSSLLVAQDQGDSTEAVAETEEYYSEWVIGVSYANRTVFAGRDYGIDQFSIIPSVNYYNKSGLYGGYTGYYYSQGDPAYNFSVISAGYNGQITDIWAFGVSYHRNFFHNSEDNANNSFKNTMSFYTGLDFTYLNLGVTYNLIFGGETAHSFSADLGSFFRIKDAGIFDKITFSPGISAFFGNENASLTRFSPVQVFNPRTGQTVTFRRFFQQEENVFGLMNLNFYIPVRFYIGRFRLGLTYNYNVPFDLIKNDIYTYENNGLFNVSMSFSLGKR